MQKNRRETSVAVLDHGNTLMKLYFIKNETIHWAFFSKNEEAIQKILRRFLPEVLIWVSVIKEDSVFQNFRENFSDILLYKISPLDEGILKNKYQSVETLGTDRWCAVNGAYFLFRHKPFLVIDFGTAVTVEVVNTQGEYLGGSIAPGIRLRFQALHTFTSQLPSVKFQGKTSFIGTNTEESIAGGVINGIIAEYKCLIEQYKQIFGKDLEVYLTGGDSPFFEINLKNANFGNSFLVPVGAYAIFRKNYNL